MAQPITVLRSHFYLAQPFAQSDSRDQQLLVDAAAAVEHLCGIFRLMQELVHVQTAQVRVAAVPLARIFGLLAEDAEAVLAGTGLRLEVRGPGPAGSPVGEYGPVVVLVDLKRIRQAIASMLHVVRACSGRNSVVGCSVSTEDGWMSLCLAPDAPVDGAAEDGLDEGSRLHLALAKASVLGQQAELRLVEEPFSLSLHVPISV